MDELERFANQTPFDLDGFVAAANALLPRFLPDDVRGGGRGDARFSDEVNVRLVRHLATLGLLDEAGREGREARYDARHLLQLLVVRRLMAEGHTTAAIKKMTAGVENAQLEALLHGETRAVLQSDTEMDAMRRLPSAAPSNEALEFLDKIKRRKSPASQASSTPKPGAEPAAQRWTRIEIAPGLELHRSDDFALPATPHERERLLKTVGIALRNNGGKRSPRR